MNRKIVIGLFSMVAVLCITSAAPAGINVINRANNGYGAAGNNFAGNLATAFGGTVDVFQAELQFTQAGTLYFYYHAAESSYNNSFVITPGVTKYEGNESWTVNPVSFGSLSVTAGTVLGLTGNATALQFKGGVIGMLGNPNFGIFGVRKPGDLPTNLSNVDFFANNGRMYFGYDDSGAGPDDNHDDMIVSMEFRAIPEPMSVAVWSALGLIGLGLIRRRNRT